MLADRSRFDRSRATSSETPSVSLERSRYVVPAVAAAAVWASTSRRVGPIVACRWPTRLRQLSSVPGATPPSASAAPEPASASTASLVALRARFRRATTSGTCPAFTHVVRTPSDSRSEATLVSASLGSRSRLYWRWASRSDIRAVIPKVANPKMTNNGMLTTMISFERNGSLASIHHSPRAIAANSPCLRAAHRESSPG